MHTKQVRQYDKHKQQLNTTRAGLQAEAHKRLPNLTTLATQLCNASNKKQRTQHEGDKGGFSKESEGSGVSRSLRGSTGNLKGSPPKRRRTHGSDGPSDPPNPDFVRGSSSSIHPTAHLVGQLQVPRVPLAPSGRNEATGDTRTAQAREHSAAEPSRLPHSSPRPSAQVTTSVRVQQYLKRQRDQQATANPTPTHKKGKAVPRTRGSKRSREDADAIQAVYRQRLLLVAKQDARHNC